MVIMTAFKDGGSYEPYVERCAYSWNLWCRQHGHDFIFWDEKPENPSNAPATFLRMKIFDVLDTVENSKDYDQFSLVDYDTFVFPWCDDYFKLTEGKFSAVPDAGHVSSLNRSIQMVKENWFPDSSVNWGNYFNAGFFTFGWEHRPVLESVFNFFESEKEKWLHFNKSADMTDDQTVLNFMVRQKEFPVKLLSRDYNVLDFYLKMMFDNRIDELGRMISSKKTFRTAAKIVHLTGGKDFRNDATAEFFNLFKSELSL